MTVRRRRSSAGRASCAKWRNSDPTKRTPSGDDIAGDTGGPAAARVLQRPPAAAGEVTDGVRQKERERAHVDDVEIRLAARQEEPAIAKAQVARGVMGQHLHRPPERQAP